MKLVVFSGPTLTPELIRRRATELPNLCDAVLEVRPPAACGDVLEAALAKPDALALIDGYFDGSPAVWHKELLWALAQGIHVFGASSMGALRAAELAPFGMRGVGQIFERYRDGVYVDDDEVAVTHASPEFGYRAGSDALVNLRATFERAAASQVIEPSTLAELTARAKAMPYWDRTYAGVLELMGVGFESSGEGLALRDWLETGRTNQKRQDAEMLLQTIADDHANLAVPLRPTFVFSATEAWLDLFAAVSERHAQTLSGEAERLPAEDWYEEVLVAADSELLLQAGLSRALAERVTPDALRAAPPMVAAAEERFRRARGLLHPDDYRAWMSMQDLHTEAAKVRVFSSNGTQHRARLVFDAAARQHLLTELQASGRWSALRERARTKRHVLDRRGLSAPTLADVGLSEEQLWRWFFEDLHRNTVPSDLHCYAEERGIDLAQLRRAALSEYCMVKSSS